MGKLKAGDLVIAIKDNYAFSPHAKIEQGKIYTVQSVSSLGDIRILETPVPNSSSYYGWMSENFELANTGPNFVGQVKSHSTNAAVTWTVGDYVKHDGKRKIIQQIAEVEDNMFGGWFSVSVAAGGSNNTKVKKALLNCGAEVPLNCLEAWVEPQYSWTQICSELEDRGFGGLD